MWNYFVGEAVRNIRCAAVARHSRESGNPLPSCRPCGANYELRIMNYFVGEAVGALRARMSNCSSIVIGLKAKKGRKVKES
ncbi:MAG: hypothetical protein LBE35_06275 [Clostridiales bacterium]|jgi:hypothetical protein|nr:hypothetical protein [Clostridiales bacterium]